MYMYQYAFPVYYEQVEVDVETSKKNAWANRCLKPGTKMDKRKLFMMAEKKTFSYA